MASKWLSTVISRKWIWFVFEDPKESIKYPHFVFYVRDYLVNLYWEDFFQRGWWKIYTTLDPKLQDKAQEIINRAELLEEELDGIQRLAFNDPIFEIAAGTNLSTGDGFIFASSENELSTFNLSDKKYYE